MTDVIPTRTYAPLLDPRNPGAESAPQQDGFVQLFQSLFRHKRLIAGFTLAVTLLAASYAFTREREYEASAQILIDPRGVAVLERDVTQQSESGGLNDALVESQTRVIMSDSVLSRVIETEGLREDEEFTGGPKNPLVVLLSRVRSLFSTGSGSVDLDTRILHKLRDAVTTSRPAGSYVVNIFVRTKDGAKSSRLADAIVDTYTSGEVAARASLARRTSDSISDRLAALETQLTDAEQSVERFKQENSIANANGFLVVEQELTELNRLLADAIQRTSTAKSTLDQIREIQASGNVLSELPDTVQSETIARLRIRYSATNQALEGLRTQLLPSHPRIRSASAQVASVAETIRQEIGRIAGAAESEYDRSVANQRNIEAKIEDIKASQFATNEAMVRLNQLTRDAESKRAVYEAFLLRAKELGEQEQVNTGIARVISRAKPPLRPIGPGGLTILAIGLAAGLGLGSAAALLADRGTTAGAAQALARERKTGLAEARESSPGLIASVPATALWNPGPDTPSSRGRRLSPPREIYRLLDDLNVSGAGRGNRVILFTGLGRSDDAATIAYWSARAAASRNDYVLLVDADFSDARLSRSYLGDPSAGISSIVAGDAELDDVVLGDAEQSISILAMGASSLDTEAEQAAERLDRILKRDIPPNMVVIIAAGGVYDAKQFRSLAHTADALVLVTEHADAAATARYASPFLQSIGVSEASAILRIRRDA